LATLAANSEYSDVSVDQGSPTRCSRAPGCRQGPRWSTAGLFWK